MKKYLRDSSFLKQIDNLHIREQLVKVTVLSYAEIPIEEIQGKVISGSLNVSGSSAVRRNGSFSIIGDELENNVTNLNSLFSLNKKIKLELGIKNTLNKYIDEEYIWFPLGIFLITNASISRDLTSITISLDFQDKMSLLNGDCGGVFPTSVTLNTQSVISADNTTEIENEDVPMFSIIQEIVHHWGGEALANIYINDVPKTLQQIVRWNDENKKLYMFKELKPNANGESYYYYTPFLDESIQDSLTYSSSSELLEFEYGDIVGYRDVTFTWTDDEDFVAEMGSTVTDQLDIIVSKLGGNYEYFYDVYGRFIFQEKKNYLNTSQSTNIINAIHKNEDYVIDQSLGKAAYVFDDISLISSIQNSPNYSNIKNDFVVWGNKDNDDGDTYTMRYHLAIDTKPKIGNTYNCFIVTGDDGYKRAYMPELYQSFSDLPTTGLADLYYGVAESTSTTGTNHEANYTLYKWDYSDLDQAYEWIKVANAAYKSITTTDWRSELYFSGMQAATADNKAIEQNYYYAELENEWPKLYDIENGEWLQDTLDHAENLTYFLDFIEPTTSTLSNICIDSIGRRTYVTDSDTINCIFSPILQDIVFIHKGEEDADELIENCKLNGQDYVVVEDDIYNKIITHSSYTSGYDTVRSYLYQYTQFNESISLTTMPIYYLEPNTRITLNDKVSNVYGDYVIDDLSVPLDGSEQMSISASRALNRI